MEEGILGEDTEGWAMIAGKVFIIKKKLLLISCFISKFLPAHIGSRVPLPEKAVEGSVLYFLDAVPAKTNTALLNLPFVAGRSLR